MPDMNGYETLVALRECENTKDIPIIFITGLSGNEEDDKGLKYGAVDYISKPFSEAIVKLRVQNQIRIINQLRTIEYLSMVDQLTKVANRRAFDERLTIEWSKALREQIPLSLIIADIDHFKKYNDTYGHQQGDITLQRVASILRESLQRATDFVARWGGEEFVILLPHTNKEGALQFGEHVRKNIEDAIVECANGKITKLTASFGIDSKIPAAGELQDKLISGADNALYSAKEAGRNRVCLFNANF
jgi:diguanylate cyclase (GGDEF)-like protein